MTTWEDRIKSWALQEEASHCAFMLFSVLALRGPGLPWAYGYLLELLDAVDAAYQGGHDDDGRRWWVPREPN